MAKVLQIDFPYTGPYGKELAEMSRDVAHSIAQESGFLWKIWTENPETKEGGGIYLFADQASAEAYLKKHTERLTEWGVDEIRAKIFDINDELTELTKGPVN